ncbi:ureidoglycolate hydrolase [Dipodascopsis tothii]|uniref:ureidoglycolate hydrolase n=1 Tax=Dipodascopsis tothii TaxID=44089 RepID=UPI0034CE43E0
MPLATIELPTPVGTLIAEPLTPEAFAEFGGSIISADHQLKTMETSMANYGTANKISQVCPVFNSYEKAPSGKPATTNLNLFRSSRPESVTVEADKYKYNLTVLERHPFTTQTFLPMGVPADQIAFLVTVAKQGPDGLPDFSTVKSFYAVGNQAVTYGHAAWHAPMVALNDRVDFAVLVAENFVGNEDLNEVYYTPGFPIEVPLFKASL